VVALDWTVPTEGCKRGDKAVELTVKAAAAGGSKAWELIRRSASNIIAGERYYVVWRGDEPVDTFPMLPKTAGSLAERPELSGFVGRRVAPPPN
jgi:hypothetical protein